MRPSASRSFASNIEDAGIERAEAPRQLERLARPLEVGTCLRAVEVVLRGREVDAAQVGDGAGIAGIELARPLERRDAVAVPPEREESVRDRRSVAIDFEPSGRGDAQVRRRRGRVDLADDLRPEEVPLGPLRVAAG